MGIYVFFFLTLFYLMILDKITNRHQTLYSKQKGLYNYSTWDEASKNNNPSYNIFIIIALVLIISFAAFRYDVGWDYSAYYNTVEFGFNTNIMNNHEYATIMLVHFAKKVGITNLYFFINTLICIAGIGLTIKNYSNDNWMSIFLFISFPLFYLNSFSVIRIFTALGVSFYGFRYIYEQSFFKYFIVILIASMFHMSALVALSFYFVRNIKIENKKLVAFLISMPFVSNIINYFVLVYLPQYAVYTRTTNVQEGTKAIIIFILIGISSLMLRKKIKKGDKAAEIYFNIYFLGLSIYLMFLQQGTMGHRLSLYGTLYSLLLVPKLVSVFDPKSRTLLKIIIYILLFTMFILTVKVGEATYIPYRTIFSK